MASRSTGAARLWSSALFQRVTHTHHLSPDQIVSVENREIQEFARDFDADSMQPNIFRSGSTKAVAIKTGDRIATATFQFASENVGGHEAILTLDVQFVKYWIVKKRAWETSMFFKHEKYCDSLLAYSG